MHTQKELYNYLVLTHGIYLPQEELYNALQNLKTYTNDYGFFGALTKLEAEYIANKHMYSNPEFGAYISEEDSELGKQLKSLPKPILQKDKKTGVFIAEHKSLMAASASLGMGKEECANISLAANGKRGSAYGYKWEFKN